MAGGGIPGRLSPETEVCRGISAVSVNVLAPQVQEGVKWGGSTR